MAKRALLDAPPSTLPACILCGADDVPLFDGFCQGCIVGTESADDIPIPERYDRETMLAQMARIGRPDIAALLAARHAV